MNRRIKVFHTDNLSWKDFMSPNILNVDLNDLHRGASLEYHIEEAQEHGCDTIIIHNRPDGISLEELKIKCPYIQKRNIRIRNILKEEKVEL